VETGHPKRGYARIKVKPNPDHSLKEYWRGTSTPSLLLTYMHPYSMKRITTPNDLSHASVPLSTLTRNFTWSEILSALYQLLSRAILLSLSPTINSIGNILNQYQLSPHQLYEGKRELPKLPLIDLRDPRNKLFMKGIRTYHGEEKKRMLVISIYDCKLGYFLAKLLEDIIVQREGKDIDRIQIQQ